ncbi:MAG: PCRF domain-containing protein, partial [Nitrospira sp.]|nr:PCRF domain-containing protein [Nitrospira sp.]
MAIILEEAIFQRLDEIIEKYESMGHQLGDPKIISNRAEFLRISREQSDLSTIVEQYNLYKETLKRRNDTEELINGNSSDPEMKELALEEKGILEKELSRVENNLKILLLPKDPHDEKNIIME